MRGVVGPTAVLSDRYVLERPLGRGAMGVVYLARDLKHGRHVAVKLLDPDAADAVGEERFLAEIRTAARLNHPHILAVHDSGQDGGRLYYVTPCVEGESLRQRLERESRLPVDTAVRIARQVADALGYAHARGVVHRDVKPENILLDRDGHVCLADFGLARALSNVPSTRLTMSGMAVGSPPYMSPEQAAGEADEIDGRGDIYSLGCVLFEMLTGEPPFAADSVQNVLRRHLTEPPPSVRARRADVSPALEHALRTALAKSPAARHPSAAVFARSLDAAAGEGPGHRLLRWARLSSTRLGALFAIALALLTYAVARPVLPDLPLLGGPALDSMRIAVLPFRRDARVPASLREDLLLHDAFARWDELEVVDRLQVGDALARLGPRQLSAEDALDIGRRLRAGRYVHGSATTLGSSVLLHAALYDASADGRVLRQASLRLPVRGDPTARSDSLFALLADSLLFGGATRDGAHYADIGTSSLVARRAYGKGHAALQDWDLELADSSFLMAVERDPDFARAQLWLAQVRNWAGDPVPEWATPAERALRGASAFTPRERQLTNGLVALARERFPDACAIYAALHERDAHDFAAWYGLGECQMNDDIVLHDARSPSGWRFRSSKHQGIIAYRQAFQVLPSSHRAFRAGAYGRIRDFLITRSNKYKPGRTAPPDTILFGAWPTLQGDTLAFVPYLHGSADFVAQMESPATIAALIHQRRIFSELATTWARAFPDSPDVLEALAISLGMLGDRAALDTLRRARDLAVDPEQQRRLATAEVWARIRFDAPLDRRSVAIAVALADSLLIGSPTATRSDAVALAGLAALRGLPHLAATLVRRGTPRADWILEAPQSLTSAAEALVAYAAVGGPTDSIVALERRVEGIIRNTILPARRADARALHLERAAILAFPVHQFALFRTEHRFTTLAGNAQHTLVSGDTAAAVRMLAWMHEGVDPGTPPPSSIDMFYPMAWLLAEAGELEAAAHALDWALSTLQWAQPGAFDHPAHAGGLVRAMSLRALIAEQQGAPRQAYAWATTVLMLWSDADPSLDPLLARLDTLVQRIERAS